MEGPAGGDVGQDQGDDEGVGHGDHGELEPPRGHAAGRLWQHVAAEQHDRGGDEAGGAAGARRPCRFKGATAAEGRDADAGTTAGGACGCGDDEAAAAAADVVRGTAEAAGSTPGGSTSSASAARGAAAADAAAAATATPTCASPRRAGSETATDLNLFQAVRTRVLQSILLLLRSGL